MLHAVRFLWAPVCESTCSEHGVPRAALQGEQSPSVPALGLLVMGGCPRLLLSPGAPRARRPALEI